jgi:hypothetical protein
LRLRKVQVNLVVKNYLLRFAGAKQKETEMSTLSSDKDKKSEQQNNDRKFPRPKAWALEWDRRGLSEVRRNEYTPPKPKSR